MAASKSKSKVSKNGTIVVSSRYGSKKEWWNVTDDEQPLEVALFDSSADLAKVGASYSMTVNLGNYESARVEVSVTLPCYVEEAPTVIDKAKQLCEEKVAVEVASIRDHRENRR